MADYDKDGKRDTLLGLYNWLTDIHPKNWDQWRHQQTTKGLLPWYGDWMVARSNDERNANTRDMYGIDISNIKYPWLSDVMSNNADAVSSSIGRRTWTFSKNMAGLYLNSIPSPRKRSKNRSRRYRRY